MPVEELEKKLLDYRKDKRWLTFAEKYGDPQTYENFAIALEQLEFAVALLPDEQQEIIKALYFYGLTWQQVELRYYISSNTINRRRKQGLNNLSMILDKGTL